MTNCSIENDFRIFKYPIFSIIIPVFNVEEFLSDCILSILNQTFVDFELLLIDDGSTDNSGVICDQFIHLDSRINVFHIANSGVSYARNYGINLAKGNYIVFVDSDDTIAFNFLELHFKYLHYDLVCSGILNLYNDFELKRNMVNENILFEDSTIIDGIILGLQKNIINSPVAKIFKRDVIINNHVYFVNDLSFGEDHLFVIQYLKYCESVFFLTDCCYNYYHRNSISLTNRLVPPCEIVKYAELATKEMRKLDKSQSYRSFLDCFLVKNYSVACCNSILLRDSNTFFLETRIKIKKSKVVNTKSTIFISLCTLLLLLPVIICKPLLLVLLKLKIFLKSRRL